MVMFIILSLIVGVAAFNIVSTLVMVVQDKQADIAILRTLGATPRSIMAIFMVQGSIIGVVGTLFGVVFGVLLALNVEQLVPVLEALTGHQFLSPDVYYISDLPSELKASDVFRISMLSLALGLLSTIYPAYRASRVNPAEALRYE
jgi:lipoprotein-releasing system permease protein